MTLAAALAALLAIAPPWSRPLAPDFTLADSAGHPVHLADYRGKVVVLDFWATWCTGCKVEIPWFMEFQKKYGKKGLTTIGAAMDAEGWEKVTPYVVQHPFNYPIVAGDDTFAKLFNVVNLPLTIVVDRHGRIADVHAGVVDKRQWEKQLQALLRE
jgi:cytochrome c biogenesis protein CcmG/thiol:disulfide interchange protein DsbE